MRTSCIALFAATFILFGGAGSRAQSIYVPNADFGLPVVTDYSVDVATNMICWEASPEDNDGAIGVFGNLPGDGEYILNCDGPQAAYIFEDPEVALLQDYDAVDSTGTPSHTFTATYEAGKSYQLQAGFIASEDFEGLSPGAILQMSLYYRDDSGDMETIASTNVVYDTSIFTSDTNFVQYTLNIPNVLPAEPWAGKHIGIEFLPTGSITGGFWDVGNVQLWNTPALIQPSWNNGQFGATLLSEPGLVFQILMSTNLSTPLYLWSNVVTLTNTSGTTSFVDPSASDNQRFYQARQVSPPPS
ncbi:MAG: hypothetical protein ACLQU4_19730 [Limisphaerales bacterium]